MKKTALHARWWREQYEPTLLGLLINPFYFARRGLLVELRPLFKELTGDVLDVGCGNEPYRALIPARQYTGLDVDNAFTRSVGVADVFYQGDDFPLPDSRFDGVLCSQVLEHVFTPAEFLAEIHRVLRPGGCLVLTVPLAWDEHEQPQDYARYTSFGLRALLERAGFEVVVQRKSVADARAVAQLASAWIYKVVVTRHKWVNLATQLILIAPVNLVGAVFGALLPRNEDFYLDNVVLAKKAGARPNS
ncbi:MAG: methylase [Verrucomicrobia bacterium]|nr:methylase [Verrucomicrobiota bacterium]